ncbi:hypothetical protein COCHEDRAFT_1066856, partial [Bipolaris maydis C5]
YTPLRLDPREARLLLLHPADEATEHVCCTLETYPLTDLPQFFAIENARGHREYRQPIEVDGAALFLSFALERFLRYFPIRVIRNPRVVVPVWIDALSINQKDSIERARQVPRMGEIYDCAIAVFSYIG